MEVIDQHQRPAWPMSWREKMDLMEIGEFMPVDEKAVKSVRYIASKHFHSSKVNSRKRFTVRLDRKSSGYKLWRKNDDEQEE